jgi:preprotein translocase subunit YajC
VLTITPVAVAFAQDATGGGQSTIFSIAPLVILFVIFYFFLIRPQQKRAKEHKEMLSKVTQGDNIITTGGIHGRVTQVGDETLTVEIAEKIRVKVSRSAVSIRKPKD